MKFKDSTIKGILLEGSYVSNEDIEKAEKYASTHGTSFTEYLLNEELINKDILGQALAESFSIPYSNIRVNAPTQEQILLIPEDKAKKFHIIFVSEDKEGVIIATDDPAQEGLSAELKQLFPDKKVKISFALEEDIESFFTVYTKGLETEFARIIENKGQIAPEIVDQIFEDALLLRVSDIHFEPQERETIVRFRIDGVLQEAGRIPKQYYDNILNRIKVQAKLRIDEHFSPQDGAIRFSHNEEDHKVDLRVSIVPTLNGEKIVIRILSSYVRDLTLTNIGLSEDLQKQILVSSKKPFGMILVTGPTGSGKTTTLYSLIKNLNTKQVNITTIEDPVEYKIEGINQIQTNSQTKLTFAQGLRSIARQDPDVIFVGEIRDGETADIAVNAALTGHLLLSSFHANNAATAIPRFIDMGIEPFLLGSTLELIIAQRLVRKVCDSCKFGYSMIKTDLNTYDPEVIQYLNKTQNLYKGKGCPVCSHTGYNGRIGVFEYIHMSPELQDLISKSPSTKEVNELVKKQGFKTMFEDGIEKVKLGVTTIDELLRVVPLD
jgi:type II secretory ATPase GspE/PulE/Tfp pilus assembly ATPase PilB-like protein